MKKILFSLFLLAVSVAVASGRPRGARWLTFPRKNNAGRQAVSYTEHFYPQILDHFDFGEIRLFPQRYLVHNESWSGPPAPIFVYCGNEGDIEWFAENTGFMFDIAPEFGALLVFPEHRYYGKSMPFGDKNKSYSGPETLNYLSTEQALADLATFIVDLKKNLSAQASPVVVFGGSYGGMMAAWFRLKYPHITIGAIASSAPILQFEDIVPSDTFYNIVSKDFKRESNDCYEYIRSSWDAIDEVAGQPGGLGELASTFRLCGDLKSAGDLYDWLESAYSYLAMVDYPYPANFMMPLPANPVREVCKAMVSAPTGSDTLSRIYAGVNVYYNYTGDVKCFDIDYVPHGLDGWDWQACTEMVMPMSCNPNTSMFPPSTWDEAEYSKWCKSDFGARIRPTWVTTEFGGHDIKHVLRLSASNIVFTNGLLDPWSGGGVLENISDTVVAFVTEGGAHHLDLRWSRDDDPDWLKQQRQAGVQQIKRWLKPVDDVLEEM